MKLIIQTKNYINKNNFICYNYENISLYKNIKGAKIYQLSSKINLIGNKSLTKLNEKILLVLLNHEQLYTINLRNMKIEEIKLPFIIHYDKVMINGQLFYESKSEPYSFIYNNKDNIYIYSDDILYHIKYNNNEFNLVESFKFNKLQVVNYISNNYIKLNNIVINCTNNLDFYYNNFFSIKYDIDEFYNDIIYFRPQIELNTGKELNIKYLLESNNKETIYIKIFGEIKKKNKSIRRYKLNSKKIINYAKSFKKKYR